MQLIYPLTTERLVIRALSPTTWTVITRSSRTRTSCAISTSDPSIDRRRKNISRAGASWTSPAKVDGSISASK